MALSVVNTVHSINSKKKNSPPVPVPGFSFASLLSINGVSSQINSTYFACSGQGPYLMLTNYNNQAYTSSDNGTTWSTNLVPTLSSNLRQSWISFNGQHRIVMSAGNSYYVSINGTNLVRSNVDSNIGGTCFVSDNGNLKVIGTGTVGCSLVRDISSATTINSVSISLNYSPKYMVGSTDGSYVLTATNNTGFVRLILNQFTSIIDISNRLIGFSSFDAVHSVAMSSTGQYMYVASFYGFKIWRSTNFGTTWTNITGTGGLLAQINANDNYYTMCVSRSGQYCIFSTYILSDKKAYAYLSSDYGSTFQRTLLFSSTTDMAIVPCTVTHDSNGVPVRAIIPTYAFGVYVINITGV